MIRYDLIKSLVEAPGISGSEQVVVEAVLRWLDPAYYTITRDPAGNLFVTNPGRRPKKKILLDAHMDDVGVRVTGISEDGKLLFHPVGGVDPFTLPGKGVYIGPQGIFGVFCIFPDPKSSPLDEREMYIDVGCSTREEAQGLVEIGDEGNFESEFIAFGNGFLKARNFDDRIGCAAMLETLLEKLDVEFTAVFSVREEVGIYGSHIAAKRLNPDVVICIEGGASGDIPRFAQDEKVGILGEGPMLSVRNEFTVFDVALNRRVMEIARENGIRCQLRRGCAGGCDAFQMQQLCGAQAMTLAPPTRYLHTHNSVIAERDYEDTKSLVRVLIEEFAKENDDGL